MESENVVINYFLDYWEDLFSGISSKRDLLTIFNPRVVIRELYDEITLNKISNKANEEFFRRTLSSYLKNDPASKKRLKLRLHMMIKEFDLTKHRPRYLPQLCQTTLKLFDSFAYFEDCIESLLEIIACKRFDDNKKTDIKTIINHLIVEFREIGYADDEIRKFPQNIFSTLYYHEEYLMWNFPHEYSCDNWKDKEIRENYYKILENYQATLTEKDRIRALLTIAKKEKELIRYIFPVNGMIGTEEIEVAGVIFYSPARRQLIENNKYPDIYNELFKRKPETKPINASVVVETLSAKYGEIIARSKIEKAFALCRLIMNGENRLWLSKSHLELDKNNNVGFSSHTFERDDDDFTKRFELDYRNQPRLENDLIKIEKTKRISEENGWDRRFNEACYWLRRADENDAYVDKLLSYWICIETLCSKSEEDKTNWFVTSDNQKETDIFLIREVVGKMRAVSKCYEHGWMLHRLLRNMISNPFKKLNIPEDLVLNAQLNPKVGESMHLKNFIDYSQEIKKYTQNELLKEQLTELHLFYNDRKQALNTLKIHLQIAQDELAFIYRMRNKIAHDGNSEHPLLASVCKIAQNYAFSLFNQISRAVIENKGFELDKILIMAVYEYDLIELQLQTECPVDIFLMEKDK